MWTEQASSPSPPSPLAWEEGQMSRSHRLRAVVVSLLLLLLLRLWYPLPRRWFFEAPLSSTPMRACVWTAARTRIGREEEEGDFLEVHRRPPLSGRGRKRPGIGACSDPASSRSARRRRRAANAEEEGGRRASHAANGPRSSRRGEGGRGRGRRRTKVWNVSNICYSLVVCQSTSPETSDNKK